MTSAGCSGEETHAGRTQNCQRAPVLFLELKKEELVLTKRLWEKDGHGVGTVCPCPLDCTRNRSGLLSVTPGLPKCLCGFYSPGSGERSAPSTTLSGFLPTEWITRQNPSPAGDGGGSEVPGYTRAVLIHVTQPRTAARTWGTWGKFQLRLVNHSLGIHSL